jgi:hypothetical protein
MSPFNSLPHIPQARPGLREDIPAAVLSTREPSAQVGQGQVDRKRGTPARLATSSNQTTKLIGLSPVAAALFILMSALVLPAVGREGGSWEGIPQNVRDWFAKLMQPDNPKVSCCGEADAYWADRYRVDGNQYVAIITDDRTKIYDEYVGRITRSVGTEILVPNRKIKWDAGNPTGHGIVFLSTGGSVICYLPPGGV